MKRRNKARRQQSWLSVRRPLGVYSRAQRKRNGFTFEQLEERLVFSTTPLDAPEATLQSAEAAWQRELQWAMIQAADATVDVPLQYVTKALPNDPLFENQWHLLNVGQETGQPNLQDLFGVAGEDINVVPAWNLGYTGEGVLIGVIDTGVQLFHPDLINNISPTLRYNAINGTSNVSPDLIDFGGFHGTAVAGIVASEANNSEGGSGVAPDATIVPILLIDQGFSTQAQLNAFLWALQNDLDVTNNSWGPIGVNLNNEREALPLDPSITETLRNSVIFGRDGLGMVHVFASGNQAGPIFSTGFGGIGNYDSASYDAYVNSRYTIGVTGVDHDGQYINSDGTFTAYPEAGPSVLVAAPTGSAFLEIGEDNGFGSGIWTTDLVGDFGANAVPLPSGFDPDSDYLPNPDYTSRMNGTSAAAPMVAGVVALMLEANPNLTFRDVQEILVRSSRQNAQFESPASGGLTGPLASQSTWQTNQIGPFRNPDPFDPTDPRWQGSITAISNPIADPSNQGFQFFQQFYATDTNDGGRQGSSSYEPQPGMFTNGAGYTVSQGYGVYAEQIGYAHGVVDAEMAVKMAEQWHTLDQNINPNTEDTYTTSILNPGPNTGWNIPAAEKTTPPPDGPAFIVPGGIGGLSGFIPYWNEYFVEEPFMDYTGPSPERRGDSYIDFAVPPSEAIDIEWVEVRLEITGPAEDLDFLRIMLTSPDGTQSELNHFYGDPDLTGVFSVQPSSSPPGFIDPIGDIDTNGGSFIWTFSTNRHWGESTNSVPIIHAATGEPLLDINGDPIFRNWELHIENWSNSSFALNVSEVIFHGKPIGGGTFDPNYAPQGIANSQRVQGFVGLDTNNDELFNYSRYVQTVFGTHSDVDTIRTGDINRQLDFNDNNFNGVFDAGDTINQEPFAENILVEAYRVVNGVVAATPVAQFLTGADGNYYFDLDPTFEYEIRVTDPLGRITLDDVATPAQYQRDYASSWRITPDWFYAPDRDNSLLLGNTPGEIFFGSVDNNGDGVMTDAPMAFTNNGLLAPVPSAVKSINFLLKDEAPANSFVVEGHVYADLNANGKFDGDDAAAANVTVFWDVNRNGEADPGELLAMTDDSGYYSMTIDLTTLPTLPTGNATYQIGVLPPTDDWIPTDPGGDGLQTVFAGPGSPTQTVNFFLDPPSDAFPPDGSNQLGSILGIVFNDLDKDGIRDAGENGLSNIRVFIDANENGAWDSGTEDSVLTASNGSYFFANVTPGLVRIDVHIENEGTANAAWLLSFPAIGYQERQVGPGGTVTGVSFGLQNRADSDWGDLPDSYLTTSASNGPRHRFMPGVRLGSTIDGEVNGMPTPNADGDDSIGDMDDGVRVISNGGILQPGVNLVEVTVFGFGSNLTGWIDWGNDGQFDAGDRVVWRDAAGNSMGNEADIVQGTYTLQIVAPANMQNGPLAARFRWGEPGLDFFGPANIGEVEDYKLQAQVVQLSGLAGDYNNSGNVDLADYILWRKYNGTNFVLPNDTTPGTVNQDDYLVWQQNMGQSVGAGGGSGAVSEAPLAATADEATSAPTVGSSTQAVAPISEAVVESSEISVMPVVLSASVNGYSSTVFAPSSSFVPSAVTADSAVGSDANLLLLDEALAELDDMTTDDEPIYDRFSRDDDNVGDLELAAVFEDESNWWSS